MNFTNKIPKKHSALLFTFLFGISSAFSQFTVYNANGIAEGQNYTTLLAAFNAINAVSTNQAGKNIVIKITGNQTNLNTAATLQGGNWNSFTIYPTGGNRIISGSGSIVFDGVSNLSFEGWIDGTPDQYGSQKLMISTTGTRAIEFKGTGSNNTLIGLTITNNINSTNTSTSTDVIAFSAGNHTDYLIQQCIIVRGSSNKTRYYRGVHALAGTNVSGLKIYISHFEDTYPRTTGGTGFLSSSVAEQTNNYNSYAVYDASNSTTGWTIESNCFFEDDKEDDYYFLKGLGGTRVNTYIHMAMNSDVNHTIINNGFQRPGSDPTQVKLGNASQSTTYTMIYLASRDSQNPSLISGNRLYRMMLNARGYSIVKFIECGVSKAIVENNYVNEVPIAVTANSNYEDASFSGILLTNTSGTYTVKNNEINKISLTVKSNDNTNFFKGIELAAGATGEISKNRIFGPTISNHRYQITMLTTGKTTVNSNFIYTETNNTNTEGSSYLRGIYINGVGANLYNNVVSIRSNTCLGNAGIYTTVDWGNIFHNTIAVTGTPSGNRTSYAFQNSGTRDFSSVNKNLLKNNILWNKKTNGNNHNTFGGFSGNISNNFFDYNLFGYTNSLGVTITGTNNNKINVNPVLGSSSTIGDYRSTKAELNIAPFIDNIPEIEFDYDGAGRADEPDENSNTPENMIGAFILPKILNAPIEIEGLEGTSSFHANLKAAFDYLNARPTTASGKNITIYIHQDVEETATAELNPADWNRIWIRPKRTVTVTGNFTGTDLIRFNNGVKNVKIYGSADQTSTSPKLIFASPTSRIITLDGVSGATIASAVFTGTDAGKPRFAIYAGREGTDVLNPSNNNIIQRNHFYSGFDPNQNSAYIRGYNVENWKIYENSFFEQDVINFPSNSESLYSLIRLENANNVVVDENRVGGNAHDAYGTNAVKIGGKNQLYGIKLSGKDQNSVNTITNNRLINIDWRNEQGALTTPDLTKDFTCIDGNTGKFIVKNNILGGAVVEEDPNRQTSINVTNASAFYGIKIQNATLECESNIFYRGVNKNDETRGRYMVEVINLNTTGSTAASSISNNYIVGQKLSGTGSDTLMMVGIHVIHNSATQLTIKNNTFKSPESIAQNIAGGTMAILRLDAKEGSGRSDIFNNLFIGGDDIEEIPPKINIDVRAVEIHNSSSEGVGLYQNTISMKNADVASSCALHGWFFDGSSTDIRNNVFVNLNPNGELLHLYISEEAKKEFNFDYNNLLSAGNLGYSVIGKGNYTYNEDGNTGSFDEQVRKEYTTLDEWTEDSKQGINCISRDPEFGTPEALEIPDGQGYQYQFYPGIYMGGDLSVEDVLSSSTDIVGTGYDTYMRPMGALTGNTQIIWSGETNIVPQRGTSKYWSDNNVSPGDARFFGGWGIEPAETRRPPFADGDIDIIFTSMTESDMVLDRDVIVQDVYVFRTDHKIILNGYTMEIRGRIINGQSIPIFDTETRVDRAKEGGVSTIVLNSSNLPEGAKIQRIPDCVFVDNKLPKLIIKNDSEFYATLHGTLHVTDEIEVVTDATFTKQLNAYTWQPTLQYGDISETDQSITLAESTFANDTIFNFIVDCKNMSTGINELAIKNNFTINNSAKLTIPVEKALTVLGETKNKTGVNGLLIKADPDNAKPAGTFIFRQGDKVEATVEFHVIAENPETTERKANLFEWQYFGTPVDNYKAENFPHTFVRKFDGMSESNYWTSLKNEDALKAFTGYEISRYENENRSFNIKGELVNQNFSINLNKSGDNPYAGQYVLSNPYTAALRLSDDAFENGSGLEKTVYLFNTGSLDDWEAANQSNSQIGDAPGQYVSVPIYQSDALGVTSIPSMQGFVVRATGTTNNTFKINYNMVNVVKNTDAMRSKAEEPATSVFTRINLSAGKKLKDQLWLFTNENSSYGFDNGYDGYKMQGASKKSSLYAVGIDGAYQVNTVPDVNNTYLYFKAEEGVNEYTLTFDHKNTDLNYQSIYLVDLKTNKEVEITETNSTYHFSADNEKAAKIRFLIKSERVSKNDAISNEISIYQSESNLFVKNGYESQGEIYIYNLSGQLIQNQNIPALNTVFITPNILTPGVYALRVKIDGENEFSTKIIIK